jgi:hypothetical protein
MADRVTAVPAEDVRPGAATPGVLRELVGEGPLVVNVSAPEAGLPAH